MADRYEVDLNDLPEVVREGPILVAGGWSWDLREGAPTHDDLVALSAVIHYLERHPELVFDGE